MLNQDRLRPRDFKGERTYRSITGSLKLRFGGFVRSQADLTQCWDRLSVWL